MSKQTDALKLALEALEVCQQSNYGRDWVWPDTAHPTAMANVKEAITAIREALAQPEQEPVAYLDEGLGAFYWAKDYKKHVGFKPLYTTQPHRKPLTDEEIGRIAGDCLDAWSCARAIEAAHGIKE